MVGRPRPFVHCRVTTHAAKGAPVEQEQRRRSNNKNVLLFKDAIEGLRASEVKGGRVTECRDAVLVVPFSLPILSPFLHVQAKERLWWTCMARAE